VHNAFHVSAGKSSGTVSASWHQYGCAADIQTFPVVDGDSPPSKILAARLYWKRLYDAAKLLHLEVEALDPDPRDDTKPYSGVGHVHIEFNCPL
jgi:hypothetical protein